MYKLQFNLVLISRVFVIYCLYNCCVYLSSSDNLPPDYKITLEVYCMSYNMMNNATPARKTSKVANTPKKLLQNALQKMGSQVRKVGNLEIFKPGLIV